MKKVLSFLLAAILLLSVLPVCVSAQPGTAKLYNVYGDNMLFQQNREAILAGTGTAGTRITCTLKNDVQAVVAEAQSAVNADGVFKVSFRAPKGSYAVYSIELAADGIIFDTLENVVFGELWVSGGQSNMQLEMKYSLTGREMQKNGTRGSRNVRYFYAPPNPKYNGNADVLPLMPQTEIPDCCWFDGTDKRIFNISGLGFFFAEKLQAEIGMPVGILSGSLGGSSLAAWLPRDVVEADPEAVRLLGSQYIPAKSWKEDGSLNCLTVCSGMYNKKIAPLCNFRPAGMIWAQGESDASWKHGKYTALFTLMQDAYAALFDCGDAGFPIVYSVFHDFSFGDMDAFKRKSSELADMQRLRPETRAVVSVSDVPLTFALETQVCHPIDKQPVGERMAYAAQGLVYGEDHCCSAPNLQKSEIRDGSVYLTYNYCGDTLKAKGERICGFTVCGSDGVYVPAEAEIVSADTVRVYSEQVPEPKAAMYANGLITGRCNLFAYENGEYVWPVLPTITDWNYADRIWTDFGWTDCDTNEIWREESLQTAGTYTIWEGENAEAAIAPDSAYKGAGGLQITGKTNRFSVSPITTYTDENGECQIFQEFSCLRWQNFGTMSVMLRNNGTEDVRLSALRIYTDADSWVAPVVQGTSRTDAVIPADHAWHKVTFNLNTLRFSGKRLPVAASRTYLRQVRDAVFCFEGDNAALSMDELCFAPQKCASPVLHLYGIGPVSILFNLINWIIGLVRVAD